MIDDDYWLDWTPENADELAATIIAEEKEGKCPSANKRAIFMFGMPGAGKSHYIEELKKQNPSMLKLSVDEIFMRCPHFDKIVKPQRFNHHEDAFTDNDFIEFGGDVIGYAIERLKKEPYDLVIDGMGGNMLMKMCNYLHNNAYDTQVVIAAVPKRIMDMNMLTRFIGTRKGKEKHFSFNLMRSQSIVESYARNINLLERNGFNLQIVNPISKKVLYPKKTVKAANAFLHEFSRPLSKRETQELQRRYELLRPIADKLENEIERRQLRNALNCCLRPFTAPNYKIPER